MRRRHLVIWGPIAAVVLALGLVGAANWPTIRFAADSVTQHRLCTLDVKPGGVAALGDSITAGHHQAWISMGADDSYIDTLGCGGGIVYSGNAGVWKERSDEVLARVDGVIGFRPSTVAVMVGSNDVIQGRTADTVANLDAIRARLEAAGIKVVVGLVPPSDLHGPDVVELNARINDWATQSTVTTFDSFTALATEDGRYRPGMTLDGIHPSPEGARAIADALAQTLAG